MSTQTKMPAWLKNFDVVYGEDVETKATNEFDQVMTSSGNKNFVEGEVFAGRVVGISDEFVTVDIGYKQEGLVFAKEFRNFDGTLNVKMGDEIQVYLDRLESSMGNLVLSKDKAEILKAWDKISEACEKGEAVLGTVISKVKGGLSVDIGVKAFLPGSQIDIRPVKNLDKFIGKKMEFKVIKFNKKRGNIVLSRRAVLADERGKLRDETLKQIQEGMVVKGIVKNITDYGAFIDLGGVDGLLHITDMSWGRVKHPSALLNVGDEIDVKILKYDAQKERVSLGLKQVQENPWDTAKDRYVPGTKVTGEVVSVKDYGVFVELSDGIEGLVHISELSWVSSKGKAGGKQYAPGEKLEAVVLEVDTENKRISLGVKQLLENPWDALSAKFKAGQAVEGKVKAIVDFGLFIDLGEEVDALIHVSDISWTKKNVNLNEEFKVGKTLKAVVVSVDKENQKFCLGLKQLEEDPWKRIDERMPVGSVVEGEVARTTEFGAFVEVETGIEGLVHVSELSDDHVKTPTDVVKKGDKVKAMVISIDKDAKKIALSMKQVGKEGGEYKTHMKEEVKSAKLADKFKGFSVKE